MYFGIGHQKSSQNLHGMTIRHRLYCQLVLKILSGNKLRHKSRAITLVQMCKKIMCNNPNVDLVNMNAYIKFGELMTICSQDIEWKRNLGAN